MLLEKDLCYQVQGCVYEVYRQLGHGFLEKVYERSLLRELEIQGLDVKCQVPYEVFYKGMSVGEYCADMVIEGRLILELKAQENYSKAWEAQLLNYLHISGISIGL